MSLTLICTSYFYQETTMLPPSRYEIPPIRLDVKIVKVMGGMNVEIDDNMLDTDRKAQSIFDVLLRAIEEAQKVIQNIIDRLTTAKSAPNKLEEVAAIRKVCTSGRMQNVNPTKVDVFLKSANGEFYLFDIKTAKPNVGGFKEFKRTLLEWVAAVLASDPEAKVNTLIAIPYNPYEPKPYSRWTIRGMIDLKHELKVAKEF